MSGNGIVRLEALRINNFKNVVNGEIFFSEQKKVSRGDIDEDSFSNILGIYGQNGSGKTTCLDALRLIQRLFTGINIPLFYADFITSKRDNLSVGADFLIKRNDIHYYVEYDIKLGLLKSRDSIGVLKLNLEILEEKLSFYKINGQKKKYNYYHFDNENKVSKSFLDKLNPNDSAIYSYTANFESNTTVNGLGLFSTIFNPKLMSLVVQNNKDTVGDYLNILYDLKDFAINNLAIYTINYFNENTDVGIRFRIKDNDLNADFNRSSGDIFVPFSINNLPKNSFLLFKKNINRINKVLPSIIPNYKVDIMEANNLHQLSGKDVISFILMSDKNGIKVPLIHESNGIKKIISILSGFIDAYNHEGCLMAIDELDSGIFEYLLGEIVYTFDKFGSGQLLFTSHNMRILEKLNYKNIMFTTTDKENAFIQLSSIKENNNLRDLYYRYIANGYKDNLKLYDMVKTEDLITNLYMKDDE